MSERYEQVSSLNQRECTLDSSILQPGPVVQRVDWIIHWISCYSVDEICRKTQYSHMNLIQNEGKSV